MRNNLAIHFAVTFEPPAGAPPGREDDPSGSSKGNNLPPIQRPDSGPVVLDLPPGATPRIDLFVTVGVEGEEGKDGKAERSETSAEAPSQSKDTSGSGPRRREEGKLVGPRRRK